ncbi:MAG: 16S rRNA (guanine(527)-N(7))-methyltransferase RsmG [Candidatus Rokuibacteriota bacterium]
MSGVERERFEKYLKLLIDWSKTYRLVGSTEPRWIIERLLLDSLLFLRAVPDLGGALLDLGSGAGLPGLPLRIVLPGLELTMVEARRRRASFLSTVVRELGLERTTVVSERAESAVKRLAHSFDFVVMRCAGSPDDLMPLASSFVRSGGAVVASGPPRPRPLRYGEWVAVEGVRPGEIRRFAVYRPGQVASV